MVSAMMDVSASRTAIPGSPMDQRASDAAPQALPPAIRADLSPREQQLYLDAFDGAWRRYADLADREAFCHRLARSAIRWERRLEQSALPSGARTPKEKAAGPAA